MPPSNTCSNLRGGSSALHGELAQEFPNRSSVDVLKGIDVFYEVAANLKAPSLPTVAARYSCSDENRIHCLNSRGRYIYKFTRNVVRGGKSMFSFCYILRPMCWLRMAWVVELAGRKTLETRDRYQGCTNAVKGI